MNQSPEALSPEETLQMLRELRGRQIELERQNEELLREKTELVADRVRYLDLYDNAPAGYLTVSAKGLILEANLAVATLLGLARADLINQPISRFMLKDDRDVNTLHLKHLFETGQPQVNELRMVKKAGTTFWALLKTTAMQDAYGVSKCCILLSDITERKQAEAYGEMGREVLQILNEPGNLQDSIQRVLDVLKMRTGFDAVGIRLQDGNDFPYYAQKGFSKDFLLTENTLIERAADGGVCRDKDGKVKLECTCGLVISGRTDPVDPLFTPGGSCWTNDSFPLLDIPAGKDPRLHPRNHCIHQGYASVALVPIRNQDRIVGLIQINDRRKGRLTLNAVELLEGIASHIGAAMMRKRAEEERLVFEQHLQQLLKAESLNCMAGAIAHHFNNQLQAVSGNLDLALEYLPQDVDAARRLVRAKEAVFKAGEVSRLMLTYLGQVTGTREHLDLSEVCSRCLPRIQASMPKDVALETDLHSPGPAISANVFQIQQILTNLVTNAWEAVGDDQRTIHLNAKTVCSADIPTSHRFPFGWQPDGNPYACLEVSDSGCGISDKEIDKVFDPFFSSKFTGRGMGLSVVLGIVRAHGGVVTVESSIGRGSFFRVFLPLSSKEIDGCFPIHPFR